MPPPSCIARAAAWAAAAVNSTGRPADDIRHGACAFRDEGRAYFCVRILIACYGAISSIYSPPHDFRDADGANGTTANKASLFAH